MIVVNTPHNPVGKVFTREELEKIADVAKEFNLLVMADEVVGIHGNYPPLYAQGRCLHLVRDSDVRRQRAHSNGKLARYVGTYSDGGLGRE